MDDVDKCSVSLLTKYHRWISRGHMNVSFRPQKKHQRAPVRLTRVVLGASGNVMVMGC